MQTPILRLTPSPGDTPTAHTRSDALGDAVQLRFAGSVARYSHADWKREQNAEPTCHATIRYLSIGRPLALPPTFWRANPRTSIPPAQTSRSWRVRIDYIQPMTTSFYSSVTRHCRLQRLTNSTVGRAACLLNDQPIRIYVPLLMSPWVMQARHSMASRHLGTTRTLRMLERFIGALT